MKLAGCFAYAAGTAVFVYTARPSAPWLLFVCVFVAAFGVASWARGPT